MVEQQEQSSAATPSAKEDSKHVMDCWVNYEDRDNAKIDKFYGQMRGEAYENFNESINFTDP